MPKHVLTATLLGMASALAASAAMADGDAADATTAPATQSQGPGLEEILVTAEKREQSQQVVPVSIEALTGDQLQQQVVLNVQDLMEHVTGLVVAPDSQGDAPTFAIRSSKQDNGTAGGVAVYFDDMPMVSNYTVANANYDIASVDLLKGPQGTLFGQSSTGGAIVFRANKPTDRLEGWIQAGYGDYSRSEFTAMVNVPINEYLQVRIAGDSVSRPDGFVTNVTPTPGAPKDLWTDIHQSGRLSIRLITGDVTNDLVADYYHEDDQPHQAILTETLPLANAFGVPLTVPLQNGYNQVSLGGNLSGINLPTYAKIKTYGIKDTTNWRISDSMTFVNNLGYHNDTQDTFQSNSAQTMDLVNGRTLAHDQEVVEEPTLHVTMLDGRLRNTTGLFLQQHNSGIGNSYDLAQYAFYGIPAGGFFPGFPASNSPLAELSNSYYNRWLHSVAAYDQVEYDLSPELTAIVGARYNWDGGSFNDTQHSGPAGTQAPDPTGSFFAGPCAPASIATYPQFNPTTCIASESAKWRAPSWNFVLQDKFAQGSMGYFRVAHGYIAGGFNDQIVDTRYQVFQPEDTTEFEAGIKSDWHLWDRPIRTNLDAFYGDVTNKQEVENGATCTNHPNFSIAQCTALYGTNETAQWIGVFNAGSLNYYGLDLSVEYLPTDWLQLNAAWTYIVSSYTSFAFPSVGEVPSADLAGSQPAQVPKGTFQASARLIWPVPSNTGKISSTVTGYFRSGVNFSDIFNRCESATECLSPNANSGSGYAVFNLSTNWQGVFGSHFDLSGWVKNLGDRHYIIYNSPQAALGYEATQFGEPLTFGFTVRYSL